MRKSIYLLLSLCSLWLMFSCGADGSRMRQQLAELEQANRDDSLMTNDSLAEALVDYFETHGSPNERMRACYILGRTYADLGELPRALEAYLKAADCADTTSADCDFKTLSRIHAQSANVYYDQIQPQSQLKELRLAESQAWKAKDTLMAIECLAQQADAYDLLKISDSVIVVKETVSRLFNDIGRKDRAAQTLGNAIPSLLAKKDINKAKAYLTIYENESGFFDNHGGICPGKEIYYYIKGQYYLALNMTDSAEFMFRKEFADGKDMNNQIAASKGLLDAFTQKGKSDSIAKYANLGYVLNDSAYSLSEMQSIQKFQASYNYNHNKLLAEQRKTEAERTRFFFLLFFVIVTILGGVFFKKYRTLEKFALDYRLRKASITQRLLRIAKSNPPQIPDFDDWKELRLVVERQIPSFSQIIRRNSPEITDFDYDVCLLTRVFLPPSEIARLKQCSPSNITKARIRLLKAVFGVEGRGDDFDERIREIGFSSENGFSRIAHFIDILKR